MNNSANHPLTLPRCGWVNLKNSLYVDYHDTEWGVPIHDSLKLFELLCLEGAQAWLTWELILNRREVYRAAFWRFDPTILALKTDEELLARMLEYAVVKNRLKTLALRKNAIAYENITRDHGSFASFIWSFAPLNLPKNPWESYRDAPTSSPESERMSKALKKYGWSFAGSTICYAYMQSAGLVADHERGCFCSAV
jgi:DNA-3-methyladenine glycosylase I